MALKFRKNLKFQKFIGYFVPLYFGLLLIYSAQTVGLYSPATIAGLLHILLIGFVFYRARTIYSIMFIVGIVFITMTYLTYHQIIPYTPLFSDRLNYSAFWKNAFWLKSMSILYLPIFIVSTSLFGILIKQWQNYEQKIKKLNQLDTLTNIYNRRYITKYVQKLEKANQHYSIAILDLDLFKNVNDDYGHDVDPRQYRGQQIPLNS